MKTVRITDKQGAVSYLTPFILVVFGMGWLVGAGANWFWGLLVMIAGAVWQTYRNRRGDQPTKFVVEEDDSKDGT